MRFGNIILRAKRFELKTEHNLGLKIMLCGFSASRTLIIPKEKKEKKESARQGLRNEEMQGFW